MIITPFLFYTDGGGRIKVKRSRSNLSWLRKSMKKLNPFQMPLPHETESQSQSSGGNSNNNNNNVIPPSTSHDINPLPPNGNECEKECFSCEVEEGEGGGENQFEDMNESRPPAVNNNSIIMNDVNSSSDIPDVLNAVLLEQQPHQSMDEDRPRQYGRRSNPIRISSIAVDSVNHAAAVISFYFCLI